MWTTEILKILFGKKGNHKLSCLTGVFWEYIKDCEKNKKNWLWGYGRYDRVIMYSLKQILEYMLGMSVIQVFPCWQEHPAHSAQSSFYNLQQTSEKIFLSLKKLKKLCLWCGIWNMLSKQQEPFIIHQKGHTDNETRFFAVAKYFFPMLLQNKKHQDGGWGEALLQPRGLECPRQGQCPEMHSCLRAPFFPPLQGCSSAKH